MPTDATVLGFSNRWYPVAIDTAETFHIAGHDVRVVTPALFIATKLGAFRGRGGNDVVASHDLEDIIAVVDGRPEIVDDVLAALTEVRDYIGTEIRALFDDPNFIEALGGFLLPDAASHRRRPLLEARLRALSLPKTKRAQRARPPHARRVKVDGPEIDSEAAALQSTSLLDIERIAGRDVERRDTGIREARPPSRRPRIPPARLDALIEEAIVDAYNESEQAVGFHATIEQHLALPFETVVLGVAVTVKKIDVSAGGDIVAVCSRGRERQAIPILELPLPDPPPAGWEWIEAYRRWSRGRG